MNGLCFYWLLHLFQIFYPDDDIWKYWTLDFVMTIHHLSAVTLFHSRIVFKKLDDNAWLLFQNVEKIFNNAAKLRAGIDFLNMKKNKLKYNLAMQFFRNF